MIAVIKNPGAGSVEEDTVEELRDAFSKVNADVEWFENDNPASAADEAIAKGHTHLCACGGDGTVAGTANSIMRSENASQRLSIVPLGTGNLIATALNIPSDIQEATALTVTNSTKRVDVGKVGNDYFLLGLGIGATEKFVTRASSESKEKLGRLAYILTLFKSTREPLFRAEIEGDGDRSVTQAEAITLANYWGAKGVEMIEGTADDDGLMECVVNEKLTVPTVIRLAIRGLFGNVHFDKDVRILKGHRFSITTSPKLPVQLDGSETEIVTPIDVEIIKRAIAITVSPHP